MSTDFWLRLIVAVALAVFLALAIEWASGLRGLLPAGLRGDGAGVRLRRLLVGVLLAVVLLLTVVQPMVFFGLAPEIDPDTLVWGHLFVSHALLLAGVVGWYLLGGAGASGAPARPLRELGLTGPGIGRELAIGALLGLAGWMAVLVVMIVLGVVLQTLGAERALPSEPPPLVVWIAGLPALLRLLISLSAGFFEELFFRGFLQPRIGILASTVLFVAAHASYDQPWMLLGVTLLSLFYALLVRWRRSLWAAISAHTLFDAVQLLIVIPALLEVGELETGGVLPSQLL